MAVESRVFSFRQNDLVRIEDHLQVHHLQQLFEWFQHRTSSNSNVVHKQSVKTELQSLFELKRKVADLLHLQSQEIKADVFSKMEMHLKGYVDWNEFCTYLLVRLRENDYIRANKQLPFHTEPRIRQVIPSRQETSSKLLSVEGPFKHVSISKTGAMCVWSVGLLLEKCYNVFGPDVDTNESSGLTPAAANAKRRVREWVTDAIYLSNCHRIAIASTGRDIRFFDTTTSTQYYEEFCLYALPNIPTCFDYYSDIQNHGGESLLLFGDDHGAVHLFFFLSPPQLFAKKDDGTEKVFFPELGKQSQYVRYHKLDYSNSGPVRKIQYLHDSNSVAIATSSSVCSLVIADICSKKKSYTFSIAKGIDCFDHNKTLNILVTGGFDHAVRLWNPYVTSRPTAILQGHIMSIVDIKIYEQLGQIFSYSRDTMIKVWDIKEQTCLQSITIKFPICSGVMGRLPEFGPFSMHLHPASKSVLVAANDFLALLKLGPLDSTDHSQITSHSTQLSSVVYNSVLKQVITGGDDSVINFWDIVSGEKSMQIENAHGLEEITVLSLDNSKRSLISAARNGTIKVWNTQNGHNLHHLQPIDEQEVTGVVAIDEKKLVIAVGWNRQIIQYHLDSETALIKAEASWKGGKQHQDDILAVDFCSPNLLATASFDGDIIIWSLETETLFKRLTRSHIQHERSPAPVERLLFLTARVRTKSNKAAVLISSEKSLLRWWSVYGKQQEQGCFYVNSDDDDSVLGLCSTEDNSLLVCGDTNGSVTVWNIEQYCISSSHYMNYKPELKFSWSAHRGFSIFSIACAENLSTSTMKFVITASADKTAKLWSIDGRLVGTFGQMKAWDLNQPITWQSSGVISNANNDNINVEHAIPKESQKDNTLKTHIVEAEDKQDFIGTQENRSFFPKVALGTKVSDQMTNLKEDRKSRREHLAAIDFTLTNRMKTQCCPFQAVATIPLATVNLPDSSPMTLRQTITDRESQQQSLLQQSSPNLPGHFTVRQTSTRSSRQPRRLSSSVTDSVCRLPSVNENSLDVRCKLTHATIYE